MIRYFDLDDSKVWTKLKCSEKYNCNVVYTDMGNKWGSPNPVTGIWSGLIGMVNTEK